MSFTPSNFKSRKDVDEAYNEQLAYLKASISNNKAVEDALMGKEFGITPVPPKKRSREDLIADLDLQRNLALDVIRQIIEVTIFN